MRLHLVAAVLGVALASGCALNEKDLCPESRGLRCVTGTDCSRDAARGCSVCRCSNPYPTAPDTPMRAPTDPGRPGDPANFPMR